MQKKKNNNPLFHNFEVVPSGLQSESIIGFSGTFYDFLPLVESTCEYSCSVSLKLLDLCQIFCLQRFRTAVLMLLPSLIAAICQTAHAKC